MRLPFSPFLAVLTGAFICTAHAQEDMNQAQQHAMPSQPDAKGGPSKTNNVKYALLMPNDKTAERVKAGERNPFGKSDDDQAKLTQKGSNEENLIRDQLLKLRVVGVSLDPFEHVDRVMLGDMILTRGQTLPPVLANQSLDLKVGDLSPVNIELVWVEKKASGLPPRKLTIPIELAPSVRYKLLGQATDDKTQTKKADGQGQTMGKQINRELSRLADGPASSVPQLAESASLPPVAGTAAVVKQEQFVPPPVIAEDTKTGTEPPKPAMGVAPLQQALGFFSQLIKPASATEKK